MPIQYVYAKHPFAAQNEDELTLVPGDKIEVVERDDGFSDGWWSGKIITRTPDGEDVATGIGLFPAAYTGPEPPTYPTTTTMTNGTPPNEASSEAPNGESNTPETAAKVPVVTAETPPSPNADGPIESAPSPPELHPILTQVTDVQQAVRQLAHRSSHPSISFASSHNSDPESDTHSIGGGPEEEPETDYEEKARLAIEKAEKLETMILQERGIELSDESDDEEEDDHTAHTEPLPDRRGVQEFDRILEETEEEDNIPVPGPSRNGGVPDEEIKTATLTSNFPKSAPPPTVVPPAVLMQPQSLPPPTFVPVAPVQPQSPPPPTFVPVAPVQPQSPPPPTFVPAAPVQPQSPPPPTFVPAVPVQPQSPPPPTTSVPSTEPSLSEEQPESHETQPDPSLWSVPQVISWLKSKGFGTDVCERFEVHEVTGDVLLSMNNTDLLKEEIGIPAFGKRMRISNAIGELKMQSPDYSWMMHRSDSTGGAAYPTPLPESGGYANPNLSHSISQSLSEKRQTSSSFGVEKEKERAVLSEPETTKTNNTTGKTRLFGGSIDSSASFTSGGGGARESKRNSAQSTNPSSPLPIVESPLHYVSEETEKESTSPPVSAPMVLDTSKLTGVGPRRPSPPKGTPPPTTKTERLSIFGASFGGSKNKSRKPVPRYSSVLNDDTQLLDYRQPSKDKGFHLPKLGTKRPGTSDGTGGGGGRVNGEIGLLRKKSMSSKEFVAKAQTEVTSSSPKKEKEKEKAKETEKRALDLSNPDHSGHLRKKGERYNTWKMRYLVLKGVELWILKSEKWGPDTKPKGYINLLNYRVSTIAPDSTTVGPANEYLFVLTPTTSSSSSIQRLHYFSSPSLIDTRTWLKALVKPTITRDYTKPVISSANVPTIPLVVAQAMNPAPRPPSPTGVGRVQRAFRRRRESELSASSTSPSSKANGTTAEGEDGVGRLSSRDARVLMGLEMGSSPVELSFPSPTQEVETTANAEDNGSPVVSSPVSASSRPARASRRMSATPIDPALLTWANTHLPPSLQMPIPLPPIQLPQSLTSGLTLLRLAEDIKGSPCSPPIPDSAFSSPNSDNLSGLFKLFDFLLDNDVKMGSISINDIRTGRRDKITQVLKALKMWEERRRLLVETISRGGGGIGGVGGFVAPVMGIGGIGLGGSMY